MRPKFRAERGELCLGWAQQGDLPAASGWRLC